MSDMWGTPTGSRLRQQDDYSAAINELNIKQSLGQIAMQPLEMRQKQAETESQELQLKQQKQRQQQLDQFIKQRAAAHSVQAPGTPVDPVSSLKQELAAYADLEFASGNPDAGAKMLTALSQVDAHEASAANNKANAEIHNLTRAKILSDRGLELLANATDEASWAEARKKWRQIPGNEAATELDRTPYSPAAKEYIQQRLMTAKQRADEKIKRIHEGRQAENDKVTNREKEARTKLLEQQKKTSEANEAKLRREGGNKVNSATVKEVVDYIKRDFSPSSFSDEQARIIARPIAERATELRSKNPVLRESEAVAQAYKEARGAGTFKGLRLKGAPGPEQMKAQQELVMKYAKQPQYSGLKFDPAFDYQEVTLPDGKRALQAKKREQ